MPIGTTSATLASRSAAISTISLANSNQVASPAPRNDKCHRAPAPAADTQRSAIRGRPAQYRAQRSGSRADRRRWSGVALGGKAQNRLDEILAVRAVDPGGAQDHVPRITGADATLARKLAAAIDIERRRSASCLDIGRALAAVEHIVGRNVNQRNAVAPVSAASCAGASALTAKATLPRFRPVDIGIGGGIDDRIPRLGRDQPARSRADLSDRARRGSARQPRHPWAARARETPSPTWPVPPRRSMRIVTRSSWPGRGGASASCADSSGSHQARLSMYHFTVRARPDSNECCGDQPSSRLELGEIDRVAEIVAGPVGHEGDQLTMRRAVRARRKLIHRIADRVDHVDVAPLGVAADVVGLARLGRVPAPASAPGHDRRRTASREH